MANNHTELTNGSQLQLFVDKTVEENPDYLTKQIVTLIGNKRLLLKNIGTQLLKVKKRLGKKQLRIMDGFSGSGIVSRFFKAHSEYLISNDLEDFAATISRCYLQNKGDINYLELKDIVEELNIKVDRVKYETGFFEELYSPKDESCITKDDRVFYTKSNACRLDNYRRLVDSVPNKYRYLVLGPLIWRASVHANTAGVFKGFYKDRETKIGQFGGTNGDALARIKGEIILEPPILSNYDCDIKVFQNDINHLVSTEKNLNLDLVYLDPPYNQHPYGSNYFMLNLLVNYNKPEFISKVSGIPTDWRRSDYNKKALCLEGMKNVVSKVDTKFILISFNNEGFIKVDEMMNMLNELGNVDKVDILYNTFRGSRNLRNRKIHVTEYLFLVERK